MNRGFGIDYEANNNNRYLLAAEGLRSWLPLIFRMPAQRSPPPPPMLPGTTPPKGPHTPHRPDFEGLLTTLSAGRHEGVRGPSPDDDDRVHRLLLASIRKPAQEILRKMGDARPGEGRRLLLLHRLMDQVSSLQDKSLKGGATISHQEVDLVLNLLNEALPKGSTGRGSESLSGTPGQI